MLYVPCYIAVEAVAVSATVTHAIAGAASCQGICMHTQACPNALCESIDAACNNMYGSSSFSLSLSHWAIIEISA